MAPAADPRRGASLADLDGYVAEARVGRAVTDAHQLQRLALRAREESVKLPVVRDEIAAAPEIRGERLERDSAHVAIELAIANDARGLSGKVEVLAFVVKGVGGRRFHEEARVDAAQKLGVRRRAGIETHVHHSHDRKVLPALRPRRADRDGHTERRRGRMSTGLVDEEREELWREDQRGRPLGRERSVKGRLGVIAVASRARDKVEMLDVLPARLPDEARVVSRGGLAPGFHREDREPGAGFDDLLRYVGAFARHEVLARAIRRDG